MVLAFPMLMLSKGLKESIATSPSVTTKNRIQVCATSARNQFAQNV